MKRKQTDIDVEFERREMRLWQLKLDATRRRRFGDEIFWNILFAGIGAAYCVLLVEAAQGLAAAWRFGQ